MARARTGITPDNAAQVYLYLEDAIHDHARWRNLLTDELKPGADEARAALKRIPVVLYCPISDKPTPDLLSWAIENIPARDYLFSRRAPDTKEFGAWATHWISDAGWSRILTSIRQNSHTKRNKPKTIKIDPLVHARLIRVARNVLDANLNDAIDKLTSFAEKNPQTFKR